MKYKFISKSLYVAQTKGSARLKQKCSHEYSIPPFCTFLFVGQSSLTSFPVTVNNPYLKKMDTMIDYMHNKNNAVVKSNSIMLKKQ